MIINIVKHPQLFDSLGYLNRVVEEFTPRYRYNSSGHDYDFENKVISAWFNPSNVRKLGLSRTYPKMDPVQYRPEYNLLIHCSNYLCLFLMDVLYGKEEKGSILIEDIGAGLGWLYVYLKGMGFSNFHTIDNFSQVSEEACRDFLEYANLNVQFNNVSLAPTIVNNVGCPEFVMRDNIEKLELVTCYTNRALEKWMEDNMGAKGFKFLCRDGDDLAVAYCREDKFDGFSLLLQPFRDDL
jgi:hypothetical protein